MSYEVTLVKKNHHASPTFYLANFMFVWILEGFGLVKDVWKHIQMWSKAKCANMWHSKSQMCLGKNLHSLVSSTTSHLTSEGAWTELYGSNGLHGRQMRFNMCRCTIYSIMCEVWTTSLHIFYSYPNTLALQKGLIHRIVYWCIMK